MAGTCVWCQVQMPVVQYAPAPTPVVALGHVHEIGCRTGNVYYCGTCGQDLATLDFSMWLQRNFDRLVMETNVETT